MKLDIKRPAFMEAARNGTKPHNIFIEILISIAVFIVASIPMSFISGFGSAVDMLTDPRYIEMLESGTMDFKLIMEIAMDMPEWIILANLLCQIFLTIACILYCRIFEKRRADTLGFVKKGAVPQYLIGAALGIGTFAAAYGLCALFGSIELTDNIGGFSVVTLILYFVGYLIQGMAEEVFCRGYLMTSISRKYSTVTAVLVSSAVFALLHCMNPGLTLLALFNLFLFGVFMALLMLRYNNIWIAGALHSLWNFAQGNLFGVQVSGTVNETSVFSSAADESMAWLNGGSFGLEGGVAVTLVLVLGCAFLLVSLKKKGCFVKSEKAPAAA